MMAVLLTLLGFLCPFFIFYRSWKLLSGKYDTDTNANSTAFSLAKVLFTLLSLATLLVICLTAYSIITGPSEAAMVGLLLIPLGIFYVICEIILIFGIIA
jgi:hypothetical protein